MIPKIGHLTNLNNWRGISLLDVCSKVLEIMVNIRIQVIMETEGSPFQFDSTPKTGCLDGSFSLRYLLQMRRKHNLDTHVLFLDLIKTFETVDRKFLLVLMSKYGVPDYFTRIVDKLYTDMKVEIQVGK